MRSALSYSALVTLAIGSRASSLTIGAGIKIGAVVGFLLWFTAEFMLYGISNVGSLTSTVVAPLLDLVPGAIAGGVIAAVLVSALKTENERLKHGRREAHRQVNGK